MMGMACFADDTITHATDFLKQADAFAQMPQGDLMSILKMLDAINSAIQALYGVVTDCCSNS